MGQGPYRVVLIGRGNVATHLGKALECRGYEVVKAGGRERTAPVPKDADIYIIAVTDSAIGQVAAEIGDVKGLVLHTAGSVPLGILPQRRRGVLYPMQTFSKERDIDFLQVPLFIESDSDMPLLNEVARSLSAEVVAMDSERRRTMHLAAVFCCNFTNRMYGIAHDLLQKKGISFRHMLPLIDETCAKVHSLTPHEAQTGPAVRWNEEVMAEHMAMLDNGTQKEIYRLTSLDIHYDKLRSEQDKGPRL